MYEMSSEQHLYGQILGYGMIFISLGIFIIAYRLNQWIEREDEK
tara:strand:+ start:1246 stop:1377 length:132 start_codon:yes stop_codon:yes gene_type:complete